MVTSATEIVGADLSASLSFFLAGSISDATSNLLTSREVLGIALFVVGLFTNLASYLQRKLAKQTEPSTEREVMLLTYELTRVLAFLSSTIVVQVSIRIAQLTVTTPWVKLLAIISTILIVKIAVSSATLASSTLLEPDALGRRRAVSA